MSDFRKKMLDVNSLQAPKSYTDLDCMLPYKSILSTYVRFTW